MQPDDTPQPPLDQDTSNHDRARDFQPEGRQAPGTGEALRGLNADDSSGSGGTEGGRPIKGKNVSRSTQYDTPGNAAEGDVGGGTTSSGTGVSGGEGGQVTL
ncbi:hypothetical protein [Hymenobacter sp. BT730]|uniref:hypothetical protein n=1 Tax=Hymenobacter sp. BT730 TaxID=3063332 RepID=UPI0026E0EBCF|nr:hypothetical protein [Hymenobacter sp. BT730]